MNNAYRTIALSLGCLLLQTSVAPADPLCDEDQGTRSVVVVSFQQAPVVIDGASANLQDGVDGKRDSVAACVRYRNVAHQSTALVRFERRYFDVGGHELGSDTVEDKTERVPDPNAKPGAVLVANAYWLCTQTAVSYAGKVEKIVIFPVFVRFSTNEVWQPPADALR